MEFINTGKAAALGVYKILYRKSKIDPTSENGKILDSEKVKGEIRLENVKFNYPTRSDIQVLKGINMTIKPGETVAFVGPAGCGKSSIIKLIERFYDVHSGNIFLDGSDITSINVKNYRNLIGMVTQEPILFDTTIRQNVIAGLNTGYQISEGEIEQALKEANAWDFIQNFPEKLETKVGFKGSHLSGGQKQRIAIARALILKPKILLLDEATSALDAASEAIVQEALDQVSKDRTTIIIAHRLSTVRNADRIFGIRDGQIVEVGPHEELVQKENGLYATLVKLQTQSKEDTKNDDASDKRVSQVQKTKDRARKVDPESQKDEKSEYLGESKQDLKPTRFFADLWPLISHNWFIIFLSMIFAAVAASLNATYGIIFGEILNAYTIERSRMWSLIWRYVGIFCGYAVFAVIAHGFQHYFINMANGNLVRRSRFIYLSKLLNQEIGLFDNPKFPISLFESRLCADCQRLAGLGATKLMVIAGAAGPLIALCVIGFVYSWELALLCLGMIPAYIAIQALELRRVMSESESKALDKNLNKRDRTVIVSEAANNIYTVASLGLEENLIQEFNASGENQTC